MTTCTFAFEDQMIMEKAKEYVEKLGGKFISQAESDEYTPRSKDEILDDFTDVVKDIKSGDALENAISSEEFFKRMKKC
jgi:hypothetical protein